MKNLINYLKLSFSKKPIPLQKEITDSEIKTNTIHYISKQNINEKWYSKLQKETLPLLIDARSPIEKETLKKKLESKKFKVFCYDSDDNIIFESTIKPILINNIDHANIIFNWKFGLETITLNHSTVKKLSYLQIKNGKTIVQTTHFYPIVKSLKSLTVEFISRKN